MSGLLGSEPFLELGKLAWGDVTAGALVTIVVLMILTGRLIPRGSFDDVKEQRDMFKEAWEKSQAQLREYDQRLDANTDALASVKIAMEEVIRRGEQR